MTDKNTIDSTTVDCNTIGAINLALKRAMTEDERVLVLGEDVGVDGGVFRATEGLGQMLGPRRVLDTPLAETGIAGVAVGLAAQGFKPVAEIQFMGFIYSTLDQVVNHAARLRNRTRGRLTCPLVLRAPYGGGIHAPEHHSESMEAMFAHVPGIRVVIPSSPQQAYGLLLSAIRDPDPVVFLEPKRIYRAFKQPLSDDGVGLPLDQCNVVREGGDVTIVTWGAMTNDCLQAADQLSADGVEVEIIDVATLKPLDSETILDSVERTGRVVVVHEAPITGGYGAEIAARVSERGLFDLTAPVVRVAGFDTIMPLPRLEQYYMPDADRIIAGVMQTMEYA